MALILAPSINFHFQNVLINRVTTFSIAFFISGSVLCVDNFSFMVDITIIFSTYSWHIDNFSLMTDILIIFSTYSWNIDNFSLSQRSSRIMRETKLNSYVWIQCVNDTISLGGGFVRLKSTVKAGGSFVGINGKVSVTKASFLIRGPQLCFDRERVWGPPSLFVRRQATHEWMPPGEDWSNS